MNPATARVTVVIPTYNRAEFLREAIRSVLEQTYQDFAIFISDDASTDHTQEVVHSFADTRIKYHRHLKNLGVLDNWRFVLTQPETELIAPLADDDCYLPNHLAVGIELLNEYPSAAYYTCPAEYFGAPIATGYYRPAALIDHSTNVQYLAPKYAVQFLGTDNPGPINSMICRRPVLHTPIFWGSADYLPHDLLLMTQLMVQGGFVFGNQPCTRFRVHAANTSLSLARKKIFRFNVMAWFGIRWLAQFLLNRALCTLDDIERHGLQSKNWERHVVPVVLALASYASTPELQTVAKRIFAARHDVDPYSSRFRLARRMGFWTLPLTEWMTQRYVGWKP